VKGKESSRVTGKKPALLGGFTKAEKNEQQNKRSKRHFQLASRVEKRKKDYWKENVKELGDDKRG